MMRQNTQLQHLVLIQGDPPPVVCIQCSNYDDSTQTTIYSPTDIETGTCPNRIVDIKTLTIVVNENLAPCNICKTGTLALVEKSRTSFVSTFKLSCKTCMASRLKLNNSVDYLKSKVNEQNKITNIKREDKQVLAKKNTSLEKAPIND